MESYRQQAESEAQRQKDSSIVRKRLLQMYRRFDPDERLMAGQVLSELVLRRTKPFALMRWV